MVVGRSLDILAWNPLMAALLTDFGALPPDQRNTARLTFLDPAFRDLHADWPKVARECVAYLREPPGQERRRTRPRGVRPAVHLDP
jgi:hypothetical protein